MSRVEAVSLFSYELLYREGSKQGGFRAVRADGLLRKGNATESRNRVLASQIAMMMKRMKKVLATGIREAVRARKIWRRDLRRPKRRRTRKVRIRRMMLTGSLNGPREMREIVMIKKSKTFLHIKLVRLRKRPQHHSDHSIQACRHI